MGKLILCSQKELLNLTSIRHGEIKLGQGLQTVGDITHLSALNSKFVLVGLPEDIGVRANLGIGGTHTAWFPALKAIANIQNTNKLYSGELAVLGHLDFTEEMEQADQLDPSKSTDLERIRKLVSKIDEQVFDVMFRIFSAGKVPIIIGGGHNNSYPILKALSKVSKRSVNTINIDAHADFRSMEGRHSGNGFTYAFKEGYLGKYALIGLHENYNSQQVVQELRSFPEQIRYTFFEDFIRGDTSHHQAFQDALNFTQGICGLEIDMDSIAGALASAATPDGFTATQVREMIARTKIQPLSYLHIAEGASVLSDGRENPLTGKLIAYLVSDFIKAQL